MFILRKIMLDLYIKYVYIIYILYKYKYIYIYIYIYIERDLIFLCTHIACKQTFILNAIKP